MDYRMIYKDVSQLEKYLKTRGNDIKRNFFKPQYPDREWLPIRTSEGVITFDRNPDFGVDKIITSVLPQINGDKEVISEIIVREYRKNPNIKTEELVQIIRKELSDTQSRITESIRATRMQNMPTRTQERAGRYRWVERVVENSFADGENYTSAVRTAVETTPPVWRGGYSIEETIKHYPEQNFRRVDRMSDGHHIILEGETMDIDETGGALLKMSLPLHYNLPPHAEAIVKSMTNGNESFRTSASKAVSKALTKNPYMTDEEICICVKEDSKNWGKLLHSHSQGPRVYYNGREYTGQEARDMLDFLAEEYQRSSRSRNH